MTARRLLRAESGATAAEFAIVFPAFFLLLFGVFEFARVCWVTNTLQYAAAQGARYAITHKPTAAACCPTVGTPGCPSFTGSMSSAISPGLGLTGVTITPTVVALSCGDTPKTVEVKVDASYTFNFMLTDFSALGIGPLTLRQQATIETPLT